MELFDKYISLRSEVFAYFRYKNDLSAFPLDDQRRKFWFVDGDAWTGGVVRFSDTEEGLNGDEDDYVEDDLYGENFNKNAVYRGAEFTLIVSETNSDLGVLLRVFSNENERKYTFEDEDEDEDEDDDGY